MIKIYLTIEMESKMSAMKVIQIISDAEAETIETIIEKTGFRKFEYIIKRR